ncbi:IS3 family transposase [Candidatus Tisiphia endosymbiont of Hybos culiciformis]|uniref:IS3 family transposase n=1 Tax=Candidatus Tisiphia endosymbiont of Hybos culiciformis TaxID=3139331 RepID=UPI003CCB0DD8
MKIIFLKKIKTINYDSRVSMLDVHDNISIRHAARLLEVHRSKFYYQPVLNDDSELANIITEIYSKSDCRYGFRKVYAELIDTGFNTNKKKVQRLMKELSFQGLYPQKKCITTIGNKEHKSYPYLLEGADIVRINQVWTTDITYIKLPDRFMYFIAIIDLYSRYVVAYGLSHSLEGEFYVFILEKALQTGKPEIFNSDQGSQFTSGDFVKLLIEHNIQISMDHKGRCFDNIHIERLWRTIKQEAIYYYKPENIADLEKILNEFIRWYNNERRHQSLNYKRPADIYQPIKID